MSNRPSFWATTVCFALATSVAIGTGCAVDSDDNADVVEAAETESGLTAAGKIQVVQYNPFYGGEREPYAYKDPNWKDLPKTYGSMRRFASMLHAKYPDAAVIGMQEIVGRDNAEKIAVVLGPRWRMIHFGGGNPMQEAIFWNDDLVTFERNLGVHTVDHFKTKAGNVYETQFGGALFAKKNVERHFGFFTGKLTPRNYFGPNGEDLDNRKDDEARSLSNWISSVMAPFPNATHILAIDQNDPYGAGAWKVFDSKFGDDHDQTWTWKLPSTGEARRYDYIWWDAGIGAKTSTGFFGSPHVMGETGSDHKAVIASVYVGTPESVGGGASAECSIRCCDGKGIELGAKTQAQCRESWEVCRSHGHASRIRWNGALIYDKPDNQCR